MNRNISCQALVLRARALGDSNREVWLLGAETGPVRATVFGGPKSRLRAYASPFHSGRAWIYHNPVKDSRKLADFDVVSWRPGLREMYERAMAADAVARVVLASHGGGGDWEGALALAEGALDVLALADVELCQRALLWFFWRWADFLGIRPEFERCSLCERPALPADALWFSLREGGALCRSCAGAAGGGGGLLEAGPGCRLWLRTAGLAHPSQIWRYTLDAKSFREAKALTSALLSGIGHGKAALWE